MQPVADCDLRQYLDSMEGNPDRMASLRYFYGCLAGAVHYLHASDIRHRDLKSKNILVKEGRVFITDFGTSYSRTSTKRSTTNDRNVPQTPEYMAPEIARREPRNRSSDMWSLGVVFLEISTVLLGSSLRKLKIHIEGSSRTRRREPYIWANISAAYEWMEILRTEKGGSDQDNETLTWTKGLLHLRPLSRLKSAGLMRGIAESISFNSFCCVECWPDYERRSFMYPDLDSSNGSNYQRPHQINTERVHEQVTALFESTIAEDTVDMKPEKQKTIEDWIFSVYSDGDARQARSTSPDNYRSSTDSGFNFKIDQDSTQMGPTPPSSIHPDREDEEVHTDISDDSFKSINTTTHPDNAEAGPFQKDASLSQSPRSRFREDVRWDGFNSGDSISQLGHNVWVDSTDATPGNPEPAAFQPCIATLNDHDEWAGEELSHHFPESSIPGAWVDDSRSSRASLIHLERTLSGTHVGPHEIIPKPDEDLLVEGSVEDPPFIPPPRANFETVLELSDDLGTHLVPLKGLTTGQGSASLFCQESPWPRKIRWISMCRRGLEGVPCHAEVMGQQASIKMSPLSFRQESPFLWKINWVSVRRRRLKSSSCHGEVVDQ